MRRLRRADQHGRPDTPNAPYKMQRVTRTPRSIAIAATFETMLFGERSTVLSGRERASIANSFGFDVFGFPPGMSNIAAQGCV